MTDQKPYNPATQDIQINWRKKYGYVPASQQPEIAAKQAYFRNREWQNEDKSNG